MAEIRKKEKVEKYNIDELEVNREPLKKQIDKKKIVKNNGSKRNEKKQEKNNLWVKFRIFCHGVKSEFMKIHWPTKKDMIRYSIATIFFVVFCSLFFYLIDVIFALIQSILN